MKQFAGALLLLTLASIASAQTPPAAASQPTITFRDITQQAGIQFVHNNAAFGKKYLAGNHGPRRRFHRLR